MKRCFKCQIGKPLDAFYKHSAMSDGHLNKCKDCTKKDVSAHRQANLETVRAYDRRRASMPHRIAAQKKINSEWKKKHPLRRAAQIALGNAVRSGEIKPLHCFVCGQEKVEAHHPNYSAPLDVVWLCVPHHRQTHALVRNEP